MEQVCGRRPFGWGVDLEAWHCGLALWWHARVAYGAGAEGALAEPREVLLAKGVGHVAGIQAEQRGRGHCRGVATLPGIGEWIGELAGDGGPFPILVALAYADAGPVRGLAVAQAPRGGDVVCGGALALRAPGAALLVAGLEAANADFVARSHLAG